MNTRDPQSAATVGGAIQPERLATILTRFRDTHAVPALGAALVGPDGLLDAGAIGVRVRGGDDPVRRDERWHIGSCGKSITAALYGRLVERGDARWGAPLAELFPDLSGSIDPGWSAIAIDDVFVSQAGLPANLDRAEMVAALNDPSPLQEQRTRVAATALARPPRRPGRFRYSNLGYIVIGAAIERLTGLPFERALATHVLEPLGVASGGFGPPPGAWGHGGRMLALGPMVLDLGRGAPADPEAVVSDNPAVMTPAGRLHLSLADWARFQRIFLTGGGDFLGPGTIERLLTPGAGPGHRQALGWVAVRGLGAAAYGQQGSNTFWNAVALIGAGRTRTAMVVCNDGRGKVMRALPKLAATLLDRE